MGLASPLLGMHANYKLLAVYGYLLVMTHENIGDTFQKYQERSLQNPTNITDVKWSYISILEHTFKSLTEVFKTVESWQGHSDLHHKAAANPFASEAIVLVTLFHMSYF